MSQIISVTIMIMNSLLFSSMSHPMNMGITLLLQTLMMCVLVNLMSYSSWFSYILFLVFLGGMLVLFIYMTSIASNELFSKSLYLVTFSIMFIFFMLMIPLFMDMILMLKPMIDVNMINVNSHNVMNPLYNNPSSIITIFMVLYLFITLIVIVAITSFNKGPLRPMN